MSHPRPEGRPVDTASRARRILEESARVKRRAAEVLGPEIAQAAEWVIQTFESGGKALLFGNGGSAGDAQHIAAEWTGRLSRERQAFPAIAFTTNGSELTALGNDYGFDRVFARLMEAHGRAGDVAIAISTSGNSPNVARAVEAARSLGVRSIGLLGKGGGELLGKVDLALVVPCDDTQRIQECHITIGHAIAQLVDERFLGEEDA
ncbi:MAG: SIS domain-containing protein [Myxococcota bacterium]|nr:SIS domain-containing protein [Myxococcota bacterium]